MLLETWTTGRFSISAAETGPISSITVIRSFFISSGFRYLIDQGADVERIGDRQPQGLLRRGIFSQDIDQFPIEGIADQIGDLSFFSRHRGNEIPATEGQRQCLGLHLSVIEVRDMGQMKEFGNQGGKIGFLDAQIGGQGIKAGDFPLHDLVRRRWGRGKPFQQIPFELAEIGRQGSAFITRH